MAPPSRIAPHFLLAEFADRRAGRPAPPAARSALRVLAHMVLEPVRAEFGPVTITSGYRTGATNAAVGGAGASRHLYDRFPDTPAVDFTCRHGAAPEWADFVEELLTSGGLGRYLTHCHVDGRPAIARW